MQNALRESAPPQNSPGNAAGAPVWAYLLVVAMGALILVPKLGSYGVWDPWEPGYVQSAREMASDGSLLVPTYLGEVDLERPILACWGIVVGSAVFGNGELGARIIGVLFAIAALLVTLNVVTRLRGLTAGLLTAGVLASTAHFVQFARQTTADVYLYSALGSFLLLFSAGLFGDDLRRRRYLVASYVAFAVAILAKGPVIPVVVGLGSLALLGLTQLDLGRLLGDSMRAATLRFAAVAIPSVLLLPVLFMLGIFFGSAPSWWAQDRGSRQDVVILRDRIVDGLDRFYLVDLALWVIVLGCAAGLVGLLRRGLPRRGSEWAMAAGLAAWCVVALVAQLGHGSEIGLRVASWLGLPLLGALLYFATRRFLRHPEIWPHAGPLVRPVVKQVLTFGGIVAAVAGPWHLYILLTHGQQYVAQFLVDGHVRRIFTEMGDTGVATEYMHTLIFGLFPWSPLLVVGCAFLVDWRGRDAARRNAFELLMIIACVVTFVAFTLATTKFPHYMTVLVVPAGVIVGLALDRLLVEPSPGLRKIACIVAAMLYLPPVADLVGDDGLKYFVESFADDRTIPRSFEPGRELDAMLAAPFLLILTAAVIRSRLVVGALVASALAFAAWGSWSLAPGISPEKTLKLLGEGWQEVAAPNAKLGVYGTVPPGAVLYTGARIEALEDTQDLYEFLHPRNAAHVLLEIDDLPRLNMNYSRRFRGSKLHELPIAHDEYVIVGNRQPGTEPNASTGTSP